MHLYKTGANLYDRNRSAPVLFYFIFTGLPAVRREVRRPREQVIQKFAVSIIQMLWYLSEQVFKVIIWFQMVCFCCLRNAVDDRAGLVSGNCIDHDPVLFLDTEFPDLPFTSKLFECAKLAYPFGSTFAAVVYVGLGNIKRL